MPCPCEMLPSVHCRIAADQRLEWMTLILNRLGGWRRRMRFDFSGTTPLFRQVAEQISEAIVSGAFAEGELVLI